MTAADNDPFARPRRPGSVLVVLVLGALSAALDIVLGVALLLGGRLQGEGIGLIIAGALLAGVVAWLTSGSRIVRGLVSLTMLLRIVGAIWLLGTGRADSLMHAITAILVAVGTIVLLWTPKANRYFNW